MTPARRKATLTLGLPVLAVIFSSTGLVAPATAAAADEPGLADSPLAATLKTTTAKVVTGKQAKLSGTSPTLKAPANPLPLPDLLALPDSAVPDVTLQKRVGSSEQWVTMTTVTPKADGTFAAMPKQDRTTQYRAVPIAPLGTVVQQILDLIKVPLISSDAVKVTTQGTVTMTAKRVAKGSYVLSGKATPATAGQVVTVQRKKGRTWSSVGTTKTAANGTYAIGTKVAKGKRAFRVVTTSTPDALGASSTKSFRLR